MKRLAILTSYFSFFIRGCFKTLMFFLKPVEKALLLGYQGKASINQPIFIIGAPRTGSTILYQVMTNCWDIGYINNLECSFHEIILAASKLSKIIFKNKSHNNFTAIHGGTNGLNSPSECGAFWYRWFPINRHFVDQNELTPEQQGDMRKVIGGLITVKEKPLLFKNMNCGQRIRAFSKIFPDAIFLYCRRDPLFVAQSLLKVRKERYGDFNKWWSIMPKEYSRIHTLNPLEQVVAQIYYIEEQIKKDLMSFYSDKYMIVSYEEFCKSPARQLKEVKFFLAKQGVNLKMKKKVNLDFVTNKNKNIMNIDTIEELKKNIKKYFGE